MQAALEALEACYDVTHNSQETQQSRAIATLRSRLAEGGEAKPDAWLADLMTLDGDYELVADTNKRRLDILPKRGAIIPLYRSPPAAAQAALDLAAKVCEVREDEHKHGSFWNSQKGEEAGACAAAIRALTPQDVLGGGK
jgi:hypothetical protein